MVDKFNTNEEEALKIFKDYLSNVEVELMPNTGIDYEELIDEDEKSIVDYFESELFKKLSEKI